MLDLTFENQTLQKHRTVIPGGFVEAVLANTNLDPLNLDNLDWLLAQTLTNTFDSFYDKSRTTPIRFIPPTRADGTPGVYKSDVLIVNKMPSQEDEQFGLLNYGEIGSMYRDYFSEMGHDITTWQACSVSPFNVPTIVKKGQLPAGIINESLNWLSVIYDIVQPKYVLMCGVEATKAVLTLFDKKAAKSTFTSLRGDYVQLPDGAKAVACLSPGAVIKMPEKKPEFYSDLKLFHQVVTSDASAMEEQKCDFDIVATFDELEEYCENFDSEYISLDMEWGADNTLRTIQLSHRLRHATIIHLTHQHLKPTPIGEDLDRTYAILLNKLFKRRKPKIIGHNVRGDLRILRDQGLDIFEYFLNGGIDSLVAYHIFPGNETLGKTLDEVYVRMLNIKRYDFDLKKWIKENVKNPKTFLNRFGYGTIPDNILLPYAAWDSAVTLEIAIMLKKTLEKDYPHIWDLYVKTLHPTNDIIMEMEETGFLMDMDRFKVLTDLFEEKKQELLAKLRQLCNWPKTDTDEGFNPDSPDQVRRILYGMKKYNKKTEKYKDPAPNYATKFHLTPIKATTDDTPWEEVLEGGLELLIGPSADGETMGMLASQHDGVPGEFCSTLRDYKIISQVCKNFLADPVLDGDDYVYVKGLGKGIVETKGEKRLKPTIRTTLETGRWASQNPNL